MRKLIMVIALCLFSCGRQSSDEMPDLEKEPQWIVCPDEPETEEEWEDCLYTNEVEKDNEHRGEI